MDLFLTLEPEEYQLFEAALDYIRERPLPDGQRITTVDLPPIPIYHYRDDHFRIAYALSDFGNDGSYEISIVAVDVL